MGQTCAKIEEKKLCDDPVENQDEKTAADFCLSCGCGGSAPPTPSPPDEGNCKGADDTLKLKTKGEKTCAKIKEKGFCTKTVATEEQDGNKKKASDFCTSCGCEEEGDGGGDNCQDSTGKFELKSGEKTKCKNITTSQCDDEVNDKEYLSVRYFCPETCDACGDLL